MVFKCIVCEEEFDDDEMSDEPNVCWDCYDDEETTLLVALDII